VSQGEILDYKIISIATRAEWRRWLKENHLTSPGVWFTFYKKHTGKNTISYDDAVEEALCYGWIDSIIKKLDDEKYVQKFTPRTNIGKWSPTNLIRMEKMIKEKKMTKYGLEKFTPEAQKEKTPAPKKDRSKISVPAFIISALSKHPVALANFNNLAPSYRGNYVKWITFAKREETQLKRLEEAIKLLEKNEKLGLR
jgi:uncharacterized protein YdeI (YjbR/CyaY-like superfamily)